jgi:hypothetical protein
VHLGAVTRVLVVISSVLVRRCFAGSLRGVIVMRTWLIGVAVGAMMCAGCGGSEESDRTGGGSSEPTEGQCRNTPASNVKPNVWVDESPVVDCAEPHTLETILVIDSEENMTSALVEQLAKYCDAPKAYSYLDSPGRGAYNIVYPLAYGPSPEQMEAGESWVRCDAGIQTTTSFDGLPLATTTGSMKGDLSAHPARYQLCMTEVPQRDEAQPLTSCEKPHRAELLHDLIELATGDYPPAAELEREGQARCAELVADHAEADSLVLTPIWQPEESWSGGPLVGWCWIHRPSGLLPAA